MNEHRTPSILQRVPVILAVTAASYGLRPRANGADNASGARQAASNGKAAAIRERGPMEAIALQD
ncbi:MAG: hypothetical protein JWQ07_2046 [Ramlibacter sp.]|nr:hypothetical protein [Ramlibacter sp.]